MCRNCSSDEALVLAAAHGLIVALRIAVRGDIVRTLKSLTGDCFTRQGGAGVAACKTRIAGQELKFRIKVTVIVHIVREIGRGGGVDRPLARTQTHRGRIDGVGDQLW